MEVKSLIISNIDNIDVGVNEFITPESVNRNLELLLQNDIKLDQLYNEVFNYSRITEYMQSKDVTYHYNDLIWFKYMKGGISKLYILKCIFDECNTYPGIAIEDVGSYIGGKPNFEKIGWQDQFESVDILALGIRQLLQLIIQRQMSSHQTDEEMHKFGKLSLDKNDKDYIGRKVLYRDLSNVDGSRQQYFFPQMTFHTSNDTITDCTYRVWDNGILEINLAFRFGKLQPNGEIQIECNNVKLESSNGNNAYFVGESDSEIFMNEKNAVTYTSTIGNMVQTNRNKYVNTYSVKLDLFSVPLQLKDSLHNTTIKISQFKDTSYMIFQTSNMSQRSAIDQQAMCTASNDIVWCNKDQRHVTALLITYPDTDDFEKFAKYGGIVSNSFTCQIIGRWR